jgi:hypothetical protein
LGIELNHLIDKGGENAGATSSFFDNITSWQLDHAHPYGVVRVSTLLEWWGSKMQNNDGFMS